MEMASILRQRKLVVRGTACGLPPICVIAMSLLMQKSFPAYYEQNKSGKEIKSPVIKRLTRVTDDTFIVPLQTESVLTMYCDKNIPVVTTGW